MTCLWQTRLSVLFASVALLFVGCAEQQREPPPPEPWSVLELGTRAEFRDVFFLDAQRGWIVGGGIQIEGGIVGTTTDGGRTWSFRSGVARPSRRATSFHLNAVWFLDEQNGFIAGDGFHILRTVDGGEHWHEVALGQRVWAHLHDLQFVEGGHGWALGSGGLARTVDGGATWRGPLPADPGERPVRYTNGRALHFVDRVRGWLVGNAGLIRTTTDGGVTWAQLGGPPSSDRPDLWGVDFVDDRHGWAVGEGGVILHTADGGINWQRQSSGVRHTLMDVDFIDASNGWAVGFLRRSGTSVVLRTTDGGTTWSEEARVRSESMRSLFVLDARHAWAVGEQERRGPNDGSQKLLRYEPAG